MDLGAGRGRNAFFLAKNRFEVEAIDINKNNIATIKEIALKNKLAIKASGADVRKFKFAPSKYSLILAIQCFNFIKKSEFEAVIEKVKESLSQNGFIIISVLTAADPSYKKLRKRHNPVEENTFYSKDAPHWWHFFKKNELKNTFVRVTKLSLTKKKPSKKRRHNRILMASPKLFSKKQQDNLQRYRKIKKRGSIRVYRLLS